MRAYRWGVTLPRVFYWLLAPLSSTQQLHQLRARGKNGAFSAWYEDPLDPSKTTSGDEILMTDISPSSYLEIGPRSKTILRAQPRW